MHDTCDSAARLADVARAIRTYALRIGCTPSNAQAAVAYALRGPCYPLQALRAGRRRAAQLLARQPEVWGLA